MVALLGILPSLSDSLTKGNNIILINSLILFTIIQQSFFQSDLESLSLNDSL